MKKCKRHPPQKGTDKIVVKTYRGITINCGYCCSKCKNSVFIFPDYPTVEFLKGKKK